MALPATGSQISFTTLFNFFFPGAPQGGAMELKGTFGVYISPQVTTNVKLSATFGGWQNANPTGASP